VFAACVLFILGGFRIRGRYRVQKQGGLLVLSNHISDIDPIVVQLSCPRPLFFMAKSELFEMKLIGPLMRLFNAFPVKRGEPDRGAIKRAVGLAKSGQAVAVFPEGQLSETGELRELKPGVALIVRMAQCPVICCGINGTNRTMPYGTLTPRPTFRCIEVKWGETRTFDKTASPEEILDWAQGQLKELSDSE
jgi:1-acyl-sn-glycerol-3-phosphate acyltransferase